MNGFRVAACGALFCWACSSGDGVVQSTSTAVTVGTPTFESLPLPDAYNTQLAFVPNQNHLSGSTGTHLATFTYGDPDRQVGYAAIDATSMNVTTWGNASAWGTPAGISPGNFEGYTDNALVFALPNLVPTNPNEQAFIVVVGISDVWGNGENGWRTTGVAVAMTTNGGQTWGEPQLVYDLPNCTPNGCGDGVSFYAQVDDSVPTDPKLFISYYTPDQYDLNYPWGFHMLRWHMLTPTDNKFVFDQNVPYFLPQDYPFQFTNFRFAVGKCATSGGTCVAGDRAIVGITGGYFDGFLCPGVSRDARSGAIGWHEGDTAWTDLSPNVPIWDDPASPDCLDGKYINHRNVAVTFEPFTNTIVAAFSTFLPDLQNGQPFGTRINLVQWAPFNMSLNVLGLWQVEEQAPPGWVAPDTEIDDVMPQMMYTTDPQTGTETFGLDFISNMDNVASLGSNDFGSMRVLAVNSGPILPTGLPAALGTGVLPSYDAYYPDPNYLLHANRVGLDAVSCGNYLGFYADPNGPQILAPFTF